ncbi:PucR family transcriptional regulator [uncultured Roseobacter sp.]|uniref:PucR family transcriptional regulator n=1 Tax=uncultured Roseobacter sp. TaxID=114847 RepID=UPI002614BF7C|nr:PucR family transcriptional regulator [uncultured Roseobacter sp.]
MTNVITRYFEDATVASRVKRSLEIEGFPRADLYVLSDAGKVVDALTKEQVEKKTATAYADRLKKGGAVLLARATYKPLGAARMTRELTAQEGAADMGDLTEEVFVKDRPGSGGGSVLTNHPRFLTPAPRDPESDTYHMADWPIPLISRRKPFDLFAFPRHARMANFILPLISRRKPKDNFAFPRHARMAKFPIPLLSKRKPYDRFAFPRHARMANLILPLISRRKPYDGTLIGRHTRMANWPFPLLINGKTGTNALIPGGPRMANFPIPLLSDRKPTDKFAFPRHARMAKLILPLISRRKPFTGSLFQRHARMADVFLPLVIPHGASPRKNKGFSFSGLLRIPTLIRR